MTPEDPVTQALRLAGDDLATTGAWLIGELLLEVSGCHWGKLVTQNYTVLHQNPPYNCFGQ